MFVRSGLKLLSLRSKVARSITKGQPTKLSSRTKKRVKIPNTLQAAILFRQEVSFYYSDADGSPVGLRRGYPHAVWKERGRTWLHMWVLPGSVSEGTLPGWRRFDVNRIRQLRVIQNPIEIQGEPARFPLAPGWNPSYYRRRGTPVYLVK